MTRSPNPKGPADDAKDSSEYLLELLYVVFGLVMFEKEVEAALVAIGDGVVLYDKLALERAGVPPVVLFVEDDKAMEPRDGEDFLVLVELPAPSWKERMPSGETSPSRSFRIDEEEAMLNGREEEAGDDVDATGAPDRRLRAIALLAGEEADAAELPAPDRACSGDAKVRLFRPESRLADFSLVTKLGVVDECRLGEETEEERERGRGPVFWMLVGGSFVVGEMGSAGEGCA